MVFNDSCIKNFVHYMYIIISFDVVFTIVIFLSLYFSTFTIYQPVTQNTISVDI